MSAALRFPHGFGLAGLRMTAREYFALGETDEQYELIDGVLVMSPSPSLSHQDLVLKLIRLVATAADELPGTRIVLDTDIKFSDNTVYRPDIAVYATGRLVGQPRYPEIPPDLVIEILSPSSQPRDLITKRDDSARFGVREYWVIDPTEQSAKVFRMTARARKFGRPTTASGRLTSSAVPGLAVDLKSVFQSALSKRPRTTQLRRDKRPDRE